MGVALRERADALYTCSSTCAAALGSECLDQEARWFNIQEQVVFVGATLTSFLFVASYRLRGGRNSRALPALGGIYLRSGDVKDEMWR